MWINLYYNILNINYINYYLLVINYYFFDARVSAFFVGWFVFQLKSIRSFTHFLAEGPRRYNKFAFAIGVFYIIQSIKTNPMNDLTSLVYRLPSSHLDLTWRCTNRSKVSYHYITYIVLQNVCAMTTNISVMIIDCFITCLYVCKIFKDRLYTKWYWFSIVIRFTGIVFFLKTKTEWLSSTYVWLERQ